MRMYVREGVKVHFIYIADTHDDFLSKSEADLWREEFCM